MSIVPPLSLLPLSVRTSKSTMLTSMVDDAEEQSGLDTQHTDDDLFGMAAS